MRDNERFSSAEGGSRMLGALLVVAFVIAIGPLAVLYGRERESTATAARSSRRRTPATRRRICSGQALRRLEPSDASLSASAPPNVGPRNAHALTNQAGPASARWPTSAKRAPFGGRRF